MRAILTYHSLDPSGSPISVDPEVFRAHVRWLASGRVRVVSLRELLTLPDDRDAVALTFDDGFESFRRVAAGPLRTYGLPATVFVVTDAIGRTNAWGGRADPRVPTLRLMDADALAAIAAEGFELGAHSRTHAHLPRLDDHALEDEILGSADRLKALTGVEPFAFAYPYGAADDRAVAVARSRFGCAVSTRLAPIGAGDDRHRLPRLDAFYLRDPGQLERWGSMPFQHRLWLRAQARRVREVFAGQGGGW
ncbi:MAG: polysaccharide deacetylase family protein [Gemmatimonadota bacterium]